MSSTTARRREGPGPDLGARPTAPGPFCGPLSPGRRSVRRVACSKEGARYVLLGCSMAKACPDCGAAMEFEAHPASVLLGTCSDCGHAFTLVEGTAAPAARTADPNATAAAATSEEGEDRPTCDACGSTLTFRETGDSSIQSVCPGCHATENFVAAASVRPPARDRFDRPRSFDRRSEGGFEGARPSRPCRECGGPLAFSTNPDGTVEGVCQACGNRFTLPPRRDDGRPSGGRGGGGYDRRGGGGGGYGRRPSFDRRGPPGQGRGGFQRYARRPRPASSSDGDDRPTDRRRRRPRSDDDDAGS